MPRHGKWPYTGFGERLRALREEAGLTQVQLGEAAGCHPITVAKMEAGAQEPAWPMVLALAKALGVACTAFQGEEGGQAGGAPAEAPRRPGRPRKAATEEPKKTIRGRKSK
jgi:transcriptional regulator with XRE-family HTH domain